MSNEKPNEFAHWSSALDKPEGVPGLNMADKGAAWEKLSGRLKGQKSLMLQNEPTFQKDTAAQGNPNKSQHDLAPQKGRIARSWFWIAAACLFIMLIPAVVLFNDISKKNSGSNKRKGDMVIRIDPKSPSPAGQESSENRTMLANRLYSGGKENALKKKALAKGKEAKTTNQAFSSKIQMEKKGLTDKQIPGALTFPARDSAFLSAMAPARRVDSGLRIAGQPAIAEKSKKELKVVHINEINDQATSGSALSAASSSGGFRINLGYHGRLAHPSVATFRADPISIKINSSSQNQ